MPATATMLEDLIRERVESADGAAFRARLYDGINSYFPQLGVSPDGSTRTPFAVAKFSGESGNLLVGSGFSIYVYDDTGRGYYRIAAIMLELRRLFEGKKLGPSKPGYPWYPFMTKTEHTSAPLTDGGWEKLMRFKRFSVVSI